MNNEEHRITFGEADAGMRLDKALSLHLAALSRSRIQALLEEGCIHLNDSIVTDPALKVKSGQQCRVRIPPVKESHIGPQAIALDIVYEDNDMLVINKPPGITVHPAPGSPDSTLVNALLAHCGNSLSGIGGVARPGIVHRIDKDTSGLLVVAKHDAAHHALAAQLSERTLKRTYLALVWGLPKPPSGTITGNIGRSPKSRQKMAVLAEGGKHAVTHYKLIEHYSSGHSLLECNLETGRTHQIRVHLSHIGHAIVGDPVYSRKRPPVPFERQALHAYRLQLIHPVTGESMSFEAPLPEDMKVLIAALQ